MANEALKMLTSEFKLWGVAFSTNTRGSNHIELTWQINEYKEKRSYIIANSPGDARGWLNARADIRRLFRADGLSLKEEISKKPTRLQKALALPIHTDTTQDQVAMLRAEVGDLTELVLELTGALTLIRDHVIAQTPVVKKSIRGIKAIDYLSESWRSLDTIARDMDLPEKITYRKLYYLKQNGQAEHSGDCWRRTKSGLQLIKSGE